MAGRTVAKRFCAVKRGCLGLAIPMPLAAQDPAEPLDGAPRGINRFEATTDPPWSVYYFVDASGEAVLKGVWKDNHVFAERAVGKNGARTIPIAAALEPPAQRVSAK